jgi:BASS family bile acid:Na+ symporter
MDGVISVTVPLITFGLLVTVGCDLRISDFSRLLGRPRLLLAGLAVPLIALPGLAIGLIALVRPLESVATGLLLVALCPIGGLSNFYTHLARAAAALSVTLTGLSCLLALVTIPALGQAFERILDRSLGLTAPWPILLAQMFVLLVAPVSLGMGVRHRWPRLVERCRATLQRGSLISLVLLLALIVSTDVGRFFAQLPDTATLALLFVVTSFGIGWTTGAFVRADPRECFALATEFATRNVAIATTLAVTFLHRVEFATFATTYVLIDAPLLLLAVTVFRARTAQIAVAA